MQRKKLSSRQVNDRRGELRGKVGRGGHRAGQGVGRFPQRVAQATEVADVAKELVEAAGAARPRPAVVRGLGDTLREAANALAGPVPAAPDLAAQFAAAVIDLAR